METGPSRDLFELWAPDSRNGLIITGYSVEGTLARVSHRYSSCKFVWCGALYIAKKWMLLHSTRFRCVNSPLCLRVCAES